ncbi:MAG: sulfite exporter TauE/SafE family protein [Hyphomicrobiaceae bacterium]
MSGMKQQRFYPVRRPIAAFFLGAAVAVLGGLIGLGGAEFRLPLLMMVFELFPHRAIRINLLISLATLGVSGVSRLSFAGLGGIPSMEWEIAAMLTGGVIAAWFGAAALPAIPKARMMAVIAGLLIALSALLMLEAAFAGATGLVLPPDRVLRALSAFFAGLGVGAVSSLLGVAGGELIIPILIFLFGADIATAGTASVLIGTPAVLTGIARHWLSGHYRSRTMLAFLVLPMSLGSAVGALAGGYLAALAHADGLKILLAVILAASAWKLLSKPA